MKKLICFLVFCVLILPSFAQEAPDEEVSSYYFVRHAEKVISKDPNPALKTVGKLRADAWALVLKDIAFDAVYSTDYLRTKQTAQPLAESQGLEITLYHPTKINYEEFMQNTKGKTVLIVGHSNTIPGFVNKLIGQDKYKDIYHNNNGNLYILEMVGGVVLDKVLHID